MQVRGQVQRGSGEGSEASGEGLGGFGADNRVPEKVRSREGRGGFGAEPGKVPQSSGKVSERFQRRSRSLRWLSGSTGFRRRLGRRFRRRFGRL